MTNTSIHELMAEIDEKVNHLKKLINYQEDVEDTFTSEEDAETKDPDTQKYV
jgi:hypothetical protein